MTTEEWPRNVTRVGRSSLTSRVSGLRPRTTGRTIAAVISAQTVRDAPKALLHDHLDGGLRPATVIDLARANRYTALPTEDTDALARWFTSGADRKSLELYLEGFRHTVGVMQTPEAIERVAAECAEDLAADGIVYAEVRYAPELSTQAGLSLDEVMRAWLRGFELGAERSEAAGRPITIRAIVTAMRQFARSAEIAELSIRYRDEGVVGFDIAGPEAGFPPSRHLDAFQLIHRANFHVTIHAGEAFGLPSIWEALQWCGAERLGHGVRIVDDICGPCPTARSSSAASPSTSATGECRSRCARRRTSTRAPSPRSPTTRSTCCAGSASASR